MTFLDTNILVYVLDVRDERKQSIASAIATVARGSRDYIISAQVLNEFANVAMCKLGKTGTETSEFVELFRAIQTVPVQPEWTVRAIAIMGTYGIQFFDALLLAAAEANGCDEILTEDLSDGQVYCGVRAVNPFASTLLATPLTTRL